MKTGSKIIVLQLLCLTAHSMHALNLINASDDTITWTLQAEDLLPAKKVSTPKNDSIHLPAVVITKPCTVTIHFNNEPDGTAKKSASHTLEAEQCTFIIDQEILDHMSDSSKTTPVTLQSLRFEIATQFYGMMALVIETTDKKKKTVPASSIAVKKERMQKNHARYTKLAEQKRARQEEQPKPAMRIIIDPAPERVAPEEEKKRRP